MSQGVLPSTYELEGSPPGMTGLGGLPVYMDMIHQAGLVESITRSIGIREDSQGWTDSQVVISLVMLNLAGGKHVDDLEILQADEGFCRLLQRVEHHGVRRK
ncbi:MAG: IS1380 family transposase, partial [Thermodesulfobacteriota bacterium]